MNMLLMTQNSIAMAIRALGDAIVQVRAAEDVPHEPNAGEDYVQGVKIHLGKGAFEKAVSRDYPGTVVMQDDRTLILMQCVYRVRPQEFVKIGSATYRVWDTNDTFVGETCVLQKLLVRPEPKDIAWDSSDLLQTA